MTPVDPSTEGIAVLSSVLGVVLITCGIAYAVSEVIKWNKHDKKKPIDNKLDNDLYKLKLRPRVRAPRLCLTHIVSLRLGMAVLDEKSCELCKTHLKVVK